ncbi:MAG: BrxA family protein [Candidatus Methanoperedens sp.]
MKYNSKIIKAPALVSDAKLFLSQWEGNLSVERNIEKAIQYNMLGKTSRAFVKNITKAFKERFVFGDEQDEALRKLVNSGIDQTITDRILYYYTAIADPLLYDFVTDYIYEMQSRRDLFITTKSAQKYIQKLSEEGKTTSKWSETVCNRVTRNILTTLRDFHILDGKVKKMIAPVYLPMEAFVYIAYLIHNKEPSGDKIIHNKDWQLFLLDAFTVERLFLEAHQHGYLSYNAAGSIIRIYFKQKNLIEVVDAII